MSPEFEKLVHNAFKYGLRDPDTRDDTQHQAALLAAAAVKMGFPATDDDKELLRKALDRFGYKKVSKEVFG